MPPTSSWLEGCLARFRTVRGWLQFYTAFVLEPLFASSSGSIQLCCELKRIYDLSWLYMLLLALSECHLIEYQKP